MTTTPAPGNPATSPRSTLLDSEVCSLLEELDDVRQQLAAALAENHRLELCLSRLKGTLSTVMNHMEGRAQDSINDLRRLAAWSRRMNATTEGPTR